MKKVLSLARSLAVALSVRDRLEKLPGKIPSELYLLYEYRRGDGGIYCRWNLSLSVQASRRAYVRRTRVAFRSRKIKEGKKMKETFAGGNVELNLQHVPRAQHYDRATCNLPNGRSRGKHAVVLRRICAPHCRAARPAVAFPILLC